MEVGENKDKEKVRITYNFGHVSLFRIFANFKKKSLVCVNVIFCHQIQMFPRWLETIK